MTPEERAAQVITEWERHCAASGFKSTIDLQARIRRAIRTAVGEAVAVEREACAALLTEKRRGIEKAYHGIGTWNMIQTVLTQVEAAIRNQGREKE